MDRFRVTNNHRDDTSCGPNQHQQSRDKISSSFFKSIESSREEGEEEDESSWEQKKEGGRCS